MKLQLLLCLSVITRIAGNSLMFGYGERFGDYTLPKEDDGALTFQLTTPLKFFNGIPQNNITIDTNGAIWIGWYCGDACNIPQFPFPVHVGQEMLACYWADFDPSANPHSNVYARVVGDTRTWTDGRNILRKAHGPNVQFDATSPTKVMVIATWLNVTYSGGDATTPTSTVQCAIMSDGTHSYALFSFLDLKYANSPWQMSMGNPAVVGVDTGYPTPPDNNFTLPYSHTPSVVNLADYTNFIVKTKPGGPNGWSSLSEDPTAIPYTYPFTETRTCSAVSDPHYTTFDGLVVENAFGGKPAGDPYLSVSSNQPEGNYILMATENCRPLNFPPITVLFNAHKQCPDDPSDRPVTVPTGLTIYLFFETVGIGNKQTNIEIQLNPTQWSVTTKNDGTQSGSGTYICPPKLCASAANNYTFEIQPYNGGFQVTSNFGFAATFQYTPAVCCPCTRAAVGTVTVTLPYVPVLQNNVFGYCGNMDGNPNNDNYCWESTDESYENYQYCWPAKYLSNVETEQEGIYQCQNYPEARPPRGKSFAKLGTQPNSTVITQQCDILKSNTGPFAQCQTVPSLDSIYSACILDLTIMNGDENTFCYHAQLLAQACLALPSVVSLNWRTSSFCPPNCQNHSHYSAGSPPCSPSCDDPIAADFCDQSPVDGCFCDEGYVMQNGVCTLITECSSCIDDIGNSVTLGWNWLSQDCSRNCTCGSNGIVSCVANTCDVNANCGTIGTVSACSCNSGYFGNGYYCSPVDNCAPANSCQNGATCVTTSVGYDCYCKIGYTGLHCENTIDHCSGEPCGHGICVNSLEGYSCNCTIGFAGDQCDLQANWCASYPCTNLATCVNEGDSYRCICQPGFVGRNCETPASDTTLMTTMSPELTSVETTAERSTTQSTEQSTAQSVAFSTVNATVPTPPVVSTSRGRFTSVPPTAGPTTGSDTFDCTYLPDGNYCDPNHLCSHNFYTCVGGYAWLQTCPADLYFACVKNECLQKVDVPNCS